MQAILVTGGTFHDFPTVEARLGRLLDEHGLRVRSRHDYPDAEALATAGILVTYTCYLSPTAAEVAALRSWLQAGGRWLALHATNALPWPTSRPDTELVALLGSRFLDHPPPSPLRAEAVPVDGSPVAGTAPLALDDELFEMQLADDAEVLMTAHRATPGDEEPRPVLYRRAVGRGEVVYLALGHRPGPDMGPAAADGAWDSASFSALVGTLVDDVRARAVAP